MNIALYGKIRAGKSLGIELLKEVLEEEIPCVNIAHIEFGDPVREVVEIAYPELFGIKDRKEYVGVGQHFREYDKDIWVNCIKARIEEAKKTNNVIIVGGVRQQNEYDMLKEKGFLMVEICADEDVRKKRCEEAGDVFDMEDFEDHTETVMDNFKPDYTITNNGSKEELKLIMKALVYEESIKTKVLMNMLLSDMLREEETC